MSLGRGVVSLVFGVVCWIAVGLIVCVSQWVGIPLLAADVTWLLYMLTAPERRKQVTQWLHQALFGRKNRRWTFYVCAVVVFTATGPVSMWLWTPVFVIVLVTTIVLRDELNGNVLGRWIGQPSHLWAISLTILVAGIVPAVIAGCFFGFVTFAWVLIPYALTSHVLMATHMDKIIELRAQRRQLQEARSKTD